MSSRSNLRTRFITRSILINELAQKVNTYQFKPWMKKCQRHCLYGAESACGAGLSGWLVRWTPGVLQQKLEVLATELPGIIGELDCPLCITITLAIFFQAHTTGNTFRNTACIPGPMELGGGSLKSDTCRQGFIGAPRGKENLFYKGRPKELLVGLTKYS